ncbi:MAG: thioredoxin family protein [Phycisphaerales bacterium]
MHPPSPLRTLTTLFALLVTSLFVATARAQEGITVSASTASPTVAAGGTVNVEVTFTFENNLHIWPHKPVLPPGMADTSAIPTELLPGAALPPGFTVTVGKITWPEATATKFLGGELLAYHETVKVIVPVDIDSTVKPGKYTLSLAASFQACNASMCFAPDDRELTAEVTVTPAVARAASVAYIDLGIFGWRIPAEGAVPTLLLLLAAFAGGLLLNLMPCVLPVLPLKILGLQQSAGTRARLALLGGASFLGVLAFWLVLGGLIAAGSVGSISVLSSYWYFNFALGVAMAFMAVGLFGAFNVGLPNWVYAINPDHHSVRGAFLFGVLTAVLATPCMAPLAGGAAAAAISLGWLKCLLIFAFIGLGMGVPLFVLSLYPGLLKWLPRAGAGSDLMKQVMGMLMLAAAVWLIGSGLVTLFVGYPWTVRTFHWWAIAIVVAIAAVWMLIRMVTIKARPVAMALLVPPALALAVFGFFTASGFTRDAEREWSDNAEAKRQEIIALRKQVDDLQKGAPGSRPIARPTPGLLWREYDPDDVQQAVAQGKVVVLDFTAEWCLNCKTLEKTVLNTETVQSALKADNVATFKVDLTSKRAPGWTKLNELKEAGIPLLVITGPGSPEVWKRNAYGPGDVVDAIKAAGGKEAAAR